MLKRGITGFVTPGRGDHLPQHSAGEFAAACHGAARQAGYSVVALQPSGATPNFHLARFARLHNKGETVAVICNSTYPLIAVAADPVEMGSIRFLFAPQLARAFELLGYECPSTEQLERPTTDADTTVLDPAELKQLQYWSPPRVGDIVFNWFD